jgi:predicted transcriptional regulator
MQRKTLTQSQIDEINSKNLSKKEISEYLKVSMPTVSLLCKEYNLSHNADKRKYKPNDNYFKTWSNEMAYFLGLLVADGHVRKQNNIIMLNLKKTDEAIIQNLKEAIEYHGPIYTINKKDGQPQACLTVSSKEMVKDLNGLGLSGNKTYDFDWIKDIPDEFVSDFVRGVFDGDGCVYINTIKKNYTVNLVGTYKLTENIKKIFNNLYSNNFGHLQKNKNVQILIFNGRYNALSFLNWIYTNSTQSTRLGRKYDLYLQLRDRICETEQSPNNSHISQEIANEIRNEKFTHLASKEIALELGISEHIVNDVRSNRTWIDNSFNTKKKTKNTILITYNNKTQTIKEWSEELGIPYSTIDRRLRAKLPPEQVLSVEELPKTKTKQSEKDKLAYELAFNLRTDYKNGLKGKVLYEQKYGIKKSRYIDIIGNRTCKEDNVWWQN